MKYTLFIVVVLFLGCNLERNQSNMKKNWPSHKYTLVDTANAQINFTQTE